MTAFPTTQPTAEPAMQEEAPPAHNQEIDPTDPSTIVEGFSLKQWGDLINKDLRVRRAITKASAPLIARYAGERDSLVNPEFETVKVMAPTLAMTLPKCTVTDGDLSDDTTKDQEIGLNYLLRSTDAYDDLLRTAIDCFFDFGVTMVMLEPTPDLLQDVGFTPMRPVFKRISPRAFFTDAEAPALGRTRYSGHIWTEDLNNLRDALDEDGREKYDPRALTTSQRGFDDEFRRELAMDGIEVTDADKDRVLCATVYVQATNRLLTLLMRGGSPLLLRNVEAKTGNVNPYTLFEQYPVPDRVYPISTTRVTSQWNQHSEALTNHLIDQAKNAKTVGVMESQKLGTSDVLKNAPAWSIVGIPGFKGTLQQVTTDGVNRDQLAMLQYVNDKADRAASISEQNLGQTTSGTTATQSSVAAQYTEIATAFQKTQFVAGVSKTLGKMLRMMNRTDVVAFPVIKDGRRATFVGGVEDPRDADQLWARDATVTIEPYSMSYTNSAARQQQLAEFADRVVGLAQSMGVAPNAVALINDMGEHLNISNAGEKYLLLPQPAQPGAVSGGAAPGANPGGQMNPAAMQPQGIQ